MDHTGQALERAAASRLATNASTSTRREPRAPVGPRPAAGTETGADEISPQTPAAHHPGIDLVAAAALVLGIVALLCAAVRALCVLVLPLSKLSLLVGLLALVLARSPRRGRWILPAGAIVLGSAVLLVASSFPAMLGPSYSLFAQKDPRDDSAMCPVALSGATGGGLASGDWVDASRAALHQGRLRLQVVKAVVGPLAPVPTRGQATSPEFLQIRLRIQRVETPGQFAGGDAPEPNRTPLAVTVTGPDGRGYPARDGVPAAGLEALHQSSVFPYTLADEVFVFDAVAAEVPFLRLEVSATPWGGRDVFRFLIPASMIQRQSASKASGPKKG